MREPDTDEEAMHWLAVVKSNVTSAISKSHGLDVADLVLVGPGIDSHHDERQDQTGRLCRTVSAGAVHSAGRIAGQARATPTPCG